jgi:hypothetical protein
MRHGLMHALDMDVRGDSGGTGGNLLGHFLALRRRALTSLGIGALVLLVFTGCCGPKPFVADVDAVKIVRQNSVDAFQAFFDPVQDGEAFRTFQVQTDSARDRAGLTSAWQTVPRLAAQGGDFLEQHVFVKAMAERRWPKTGPPETLEPAFVEGVRQGVQEFIER